MYTRHLCSCYLDLKLYKINDGSFITKTFTFYYADEQFEQKGGDFSSKPSEKNKTFWG